MSLLSSTPLASFQLASAALRLFFGSFLRALPYALVPVLLLVTLTLLAHGYYSEGEPNGNWILYLAFALLLLSPALMAPLICQVHAIAHGRQLSVSEALTRGLRCLLPCIALALLYMVAVGAGAVLLLLPGLYLFVALSFWWLALVADGVPATAALRSSLRLVRGHWWHVAIGYSFIYPVAIAVNAFDVNMVSLSNETLDAIVATFIGLVVTTVFPIFVSANMVVIYHDLALRRQRADAGEARR